MRRRRSASDPACTAGILALRDAEIPVPAETEGETALNVTVRNDGQGLSESRNISPFWSQRTQDEARLQEMRPQGLVEAERASALSATGSGSTELRPDGNGASGALPADRTVENARQGAVVVEPIGTDGRGSAHSPDALPAQASTGYADSFGATEAASAADPTPPVQPSERLGMRPGERLIIEQMRDMLADLYQQNKLLVETQQQLQQRVERVENDNMQSASSGGDREPLGFDEPHLGVKGRLDGMGGGSQGIWTSEGSVYLGRYVPPQERNSVDYQAGLEEGLRRAKEALRAKESTAFPLEGNAREREVSPPPPPPPRPDSVPTTPNGTRVPSGTPPRTPTPIFGSPVGPPLIDRNNDPLARSLEWASSVAQSRASPCIADAGGFQGSGLGSFQGLAFTEGLGAEILGVGKGHSSSFAQGMNARKGFGSEESSALPSGPGFAGSQIPGAGSSGMGLGSSLGTPGFPVSGFGLSGGGAGNGGSGNLGFASGSHSSEGGGRGAYTPGDRTWWKLPALPDPGTEDACIAVSDWLTQIQPIMSDLSERSGSWWKRVMEVAQAAYARWQQAGPLEKSMVTCDSPTDLLEDKLSRLEARALGMIMESLPVRIKDELVVTKSLTCANAVYRILLAFQPGGLGERHKLLQNLSDPGQAISARQCSDQLRRWHRWLARSQDLGVNPPDPAILLSGLDKLCQGIISAHPQLGFRCNISRTQHQLDFCPNVTNVIGYARLLQAEMETLALSGTDVEVEAESRANPSKKQRAAALRKAEAATKAAAKAGNGDQASGSQASNQGSSGQGEPGTGNQGSTGKGNQNPGKGGGGTSGSKEPCRFYLGKGGCKMGRSCWSFHDFGKAAAEGRCFTCGSGEHRQEACPRPQGKGKRKNEDNNPRGESSSSGGQGQGQNSGPGSGGGSGKGSAGSGKQEGKGAQVRQATAEAGAAAQDSGSGAGEPKVARTAEASSQELMAEATKLLKGFRIAAVRVVEAPESESPELGDSETPESPDGICLTKVVHDPPKNARGLLDAGATNALRTAKGPRELECCTMTRVSLALGHASLHLTPVGTLVSPTPVAPIVPMGVLAAELHCKIDWEGEECQVVHPTRGKLPVVMVNRCPELCAKLTEALIMEIEDKRAAVLQRALQLKALGSSDVGYMQGLQGSLNVWEASLLSWLRKLSPDCPEGLLARVLPNWSRPVKATDIPLNRRVRRGIERAEHVVIHLFSGKTKARDFGKLPSSVYVLSIDIEQGIDMLSDAMFQFLCELCASGKVIAIVGGPPCATTSRLRERGEWDGGPRVVRDRDGPGRFGRTSGAARLTKAEQKLVDDHTVLYFRMFLLHHIAHEASPEGVLFGMEHPMDPMQYLCDGKEHASLWAWPEVEYLESEKGMHRAMFSQSSFGHQVKKPSTVLTNDWGLYCELHMQHDGEVSRAEKSTELHMRMHGSKQWAKWAPGLTRAFGRAIEAWIRTPALERQRVMLEQQTYVRSLTRDEKAFVDHCERDHLGFRRDCNVCLSSSIRSHQHVRQKYPYRNAFCLNLDLIGPLKKGEDQLGVARHLLVGVLGVPLFKDGRPRPLAPDAVEEGFAIPEDWSAEEPEAAKGEDNNGDLFAGEDHPSNVDAGAGGAAGAPVAGEEDLEGLDPHWQDRARSWNEKWKESVKNLREPVEIVPLVFVEPIASKRASVTLRAVQRIYTRIRLLNLGVRRVHSDSGREFANALLEKWALARDIALTASVPNDPKPNGRIESVVGRCKAGIRGLLLQSGLSQVCWPHVARQWGEQKLQSALDKLGAEPRKLPIVPAGTIVTVKRRDWSRKDPWSTKAIQGVAVAPSIRVPNSTVVRITEGNAVRLYVAPVVYTHVKEPVRFTGVAEACMEDFPAPHRRVLGKSPGVVEPRGCEPRGEPAASVADPESAAAAAGSVGLPLASEGDSERPLGSGGGLERLLGSGGGPETPSGSAGMSGVRLESGGEGEPGVRSLIQTPVTNVSKDRATGGSERLPEVDEVEKLLQLDVWSVEQAERYAMSLLAQSCALSRSQVEALLRRTLRDFQAHSRRVDIQARAVGSKCWTLGFYVYGNKVGLTNRTMIMPHVVKVLNSYLHSLLSPEEKLTASWSALRVTWGMQAGPHRDRNAQGSRNFLVPISRFQGGRLWVEGCDEEKGAGHEREGLDRVPWGDKWGSYVGGDDRSVWFDPSVTHAVEPTSEDRLVVVAYTPRGLHWGKLADHAKLKDLGFPLPTTVAQNEPHPKVTKAQFGWDPQRFDIGSDLEEESPTTEWRNCGQPSHDELVGRLSQLVREEKLAMVEELENGLSCVTPGLLSELHEDLKLATLCQEHDGCDRQFELERGLFALSRLRHVESEVDRMWHEHESTGLPCVRAVRTESSQSEDQEEHGWSLHSRAHEDDRMAIDHPDYGLESEAITAKGAIPTPGVLLQTRIVPQSEVWGSIEEWRMPLTDEVVALKNVHQAVWAIGPAELERLEKLAVVSVIPGKCVYTQKPITNRLRARVVGCGNYLEGETPVEDTAKGMCRSQDLYAGGVDGVSVRLQTSVAAVQRWDNASLDIKTAFLGAPLYQDRQGQAVLSPGDLSTGRLDFEELVKNCRMFRDLRLRLW